MLLLAFGEFVARVRFCPGRVCSSRRCPDAGSQPRRRVQALRLTIACWAGFSCGALIAGQYDYGAGYSLTYESNITRTPAPRPEWTSAIFGGVAYEEHTVDLNVRGLAQIEFRNYLRNVYQDDHSGYGNGAAVWTISPRSFSWTAEDTFRQVQVNLTQPDVPTNRTEMNLLSTGPDLIARLDTANSAEFGGRYERLDIRGPGDNQRASGYVRLIHRLSEYSALSANYEAAKIFFDEPAPYPEVTRMDGFIRFQSRVAPNELILDVGTSRLIRTGTPELDGRLTRLSLTRQLIPETAIQASYISQYSDTFTDALRGIVNPMLPGDTAIVPGVDVVTGDTYYLQRGDLALLSDVPGGTFGYSLRGYARNVNYTTQNLDFNEWGAWLDLSWRPSFMNRVYLAGRYSKRNFLQFPETDVDMNTTAGVTYALSRTASLTFEVNRIAHYTTVPQSDWVDWRAMLLLGYSTGPLFTAVSRR